MKDDCEHIFQTQRISRGQIKGVVYNHSESLADLLIGRSGQGLNKGPNKKQGMLCYVKQAMEVNHPGLRVDDWTIQMVRDLRDQILAKAMSDCGQ